MENTETSKSQWHKKFKWRRPHRRSNPETDWKIIFLTAVVLSTLIITLGIFMFIKIDKGELFLVHKAGEGESENLDLKKLEETVSYYENKLIEFEKIKNSKPSSVDPSL